MAQIKTESITVVFSKLVKDNDENTRIVTDDEYTELKLFIEALGDDITDGRIVEIE